MSFTEIEQTKYKIILDQYLDEKRPPVEIRDEIDINFRFKDQSIIIYTIRPNFRDPLIKIESPNIKFTFVKKINSWKIFWQRANMKWVSYEPAPEFDTLGKCLEILEKDSCGCFWG